MTEDKNKDITSIAYNHLNLPKQINLTNNRWIKYYYDAAGIKLKKEVFDGMTTKTTDYIGGFVLLFLRVINQPGKF